MPAEKIQRLAFALGAAASSRSEACGETDIIVWEFFDGALASNATHAMSSVDESARDAFQSGFRISPADRTTCREARLRQADAIVRFLSVFSSKRDSRILSMRFDSTLRGSKNYSLLPYSRERVIGFPPDQIPVVDASVSEE